MNFYQLSKSVRMARWSITICIIFLFQIASPAPTPLSTLYLNTTSTAYDTIYNHVNMLTSSTSTCASTSAYWNSPTNLAYTTTSATSDTNGNVYFTYGSNPYTSAITGGVFNQACTGVYMLSGGGSQTTANLVSGTSNCFTVWGAWVGGAWHVYCLHYGGTYQIV